MLTVQKNNGLPVICAEPPVDAIHLGLHLGLQIMVALDVSTARSPDLNKRENALIARIFFEEPLYCQESLENPLGVVEAVDSNAHQCSFDSESLQQGSAKFVGRLLRMVRLRFRGIHADRKWTNGCAMVQALHRKMLPVDARLDNSVDRLQEIGAMRLDVEADKIGAKQTVHQFALPWTDSECLRIRPGDVPEDRNARIRATLLDHSWKKSEMIVLYQNDGIGDSL